MESKPKVLVLTVGAWSSVTGGDTMSSLLSRYGAENVACLYIRANKSDSKSASKYFQIIEGRVLKSIFSRGVVTGFESTPVDLNSLQETADQKKEINRYKAFKKHRWGIFLWAREIVWMLGKWKTPELNKFLDEFNPDVIMFPIEGFIHFNHITEYVLSRYPNKAIGFLWDDNFTYKQEPFNITHQIYRFFLRRSVGRLIRKCECIFALSPKMKDECDREYGVECKLLTKPIFSYRTFTPYEPQQPIRILYTGNLLIGRLDTLKKISRALNVVNKESKRIVLDVYTNTYVSEKDMRSINTDFCIIHGPISQREVFEKQRNTDVLLFLESLSRITNQSARLSFSTKITDYFGAGKCIWSVSSTSLSAADYLKREDAAIISESEAEILNALKMMVEDQNLIKAYAKKAYQCGQNNHNAELILNRLYNAIKE